MLLKSKKMLLICAAFLLVAVASVFSQDDDWFYGKPVKAVNFEGLVSIKKSDLNAITKRYIGSDFSDELYYDLLSRIGSLDYFESYEMSIEPANADYSGVILKFSVEENPTITRILFVGNMKIRQTELKQAVSIKEDDIFSSAVLAAEENKIRELYLKKGFTNVRVGATYKPSDNGGIDVSFLINEGSATVIRSINFQGNQIFSDKTLKGTLKLKEKSLFNKGSFQESTLELDKQSILTYYLNRGYIDVNLVDVIREESLDNDGNSVMDITFVISEGYQYTYAGIDFQGNWLFSSDYLASKVKMELNDVFNYTKFQDGLSSLSDVYYENGYITTAIIPEEQKDPDMRQISFMVYIDERSRSHVENITVQGNKKTLDSVILREMPLKPGDIFSRTKLTNGLHNLYNSQFFSSIVPDVMQGSEEDLVNVVLNVEEQSTTSIEAGISFAGLTDPNAFPLSLFVSWKDTNFGGTGQSISASTNLSPDTQSISLGFSNPWVFDRPISFSSSLSGERSKESTLQKVWTPYGLDITNYNMSYVAWDVSFSNSLGYRWYLDDSVVSLSGGLTNNFLRNTYDTSLIPVDETISSYENNWGLQNSIWSAVGIDSRDYRPNPTTGWFAKETLSWSGLLPIEKQFFLRSDTIGEYYITPFNIPVNEKYNLQVTFAAISALGLIQPVRGQISSSNRLQIDGMFVGRGWDEMYKQKGNMMWSNNFELRVPVVPNILAVDFFLDAVALKEEAPSNYSGIHSGDFYFSFGPGVRSLVQQLPLRFMLANTFKMENGVFRWGNGKGPEWKTVISFVMTNN